MFSLSPARSHRSLRHCGPALSARIQRPYAVNSVFNPGATLLSDGSTLLLCRVEDRRGHSHLCVARSANGVDGWQIDSRPTLPADPERYPEEMSGIEDPRTTYVPELKKYAVVYTAYTRDGPGVSLALTEDFLSFERYGVIMPPEDKDAALQGWLVIYHGVRHKAAGAIYRLGLALFDLESPERCLKRCDRWVFGPREAYERRRG